MNLWLLIPAGVASLVALFLILVFIYVLYGQSRSNSKFPAPSDAMLVLGVDPAAKGAKALLKRRLELALQLYRVGAAKYIIVCGGRRHGLPPTEAVVMAVWLVQHGVPARYVVREGASRDTRENIANAKILMERLGFRNCTIITSDFHLHRALSIARHNGLTVTGAATRTVGARMHLYYLLREVVGWCKLWFTRPLPPPSIINISDNVEAVYAGTREDGD